MKEQAKKDSEQKQKPKKKKNDRKIFQFLVFNFFFHKKSLVSIKIEQEKVEF